MLATVFAGRLSFRRAGWERGGLLNSDITAPVYRDLAPPCGHDLLLLLAAAVSLVMFGAANMEVSTVMLSV